MAHSEAQTFEVTAAQYAILINRSVSTARRHARNLFWQRRARKNVYGQWMITVDKQHYRRAMVEEIRRLSSRIKSTPWNKPIGHLTARRDACNEALVFLGSSDILVELDRVRVNVGIPTAKSRQQLRSALEAIERMIAA